MAISKKAAIRVSVFVPQDIDEKIEAICRKTGESKSSFYAAAAKAYIKAPKSSKAA